MLDFQEIETFQSEVATLRSSAVHAEKLHTNTAAPYPCGSSSWRSGLGCAYWSAIAAALRRRRKGQDFSVMRQRCCIRCEPNDTRRSSEPRRDARPWCRLGVSETIVHTWLPTLMIERVKARLPEISSGRSRSTSRPSARQAGRQGISTCPAVEAGGQPRTAQSTVRLIPDLPFVVGERIDCPRKAVVARRHARWRSSRSAQHPTACGASTSLFDRGAACDHSSQRRRSRTVSAWPSMASASPSPSAILRSVAARPRRGSCGACTPYGAACRAQLRRRWARFTRQSAAQRGWPMDRDPNCEGREERRT